jgi:hypothetical protein
MNYEIKGRKIDSLELLGILEDSDSKTEWIVKEIKKPTKKQIREWVEGQFYSDVKDKTPCEDYEDWETEDLEREIDNMIESLQRFLEEQHG